MTKIGNDEALFSSLRDHLFTAVVGDVLDKLGLRRQFLPQAIGPLTPNMKLVGRAMPVLEADVFDGSSGLPGARSVAGRSGSCWRRSTIFDRTRSTSPRAAPFATRCGAS